MVQSAAELIQVHKVLKTAEAINVRNYELDDTV